MQSRYLRYLLDKLMINTKNANDINMVCHSAKSVFLCRLSLVPCLPGNVILSLSTMVLVHQNNWKSMFPPFGSEAEDLQNIYLQQFPLEMAYLTRPDNAQFRSNLVTGRVQWVRNQEKLCRFNKQMCAR